MAGKIAGWMVEVEEGASIRQGEGEGQSEGDRAGVEDRRVREVKIELSGEKGARVKFVTVGDWKRGGSGVERWVEW